MATSSPFVWAYIHSLTRTIRVMAGGRQVSFELALTFIYGDLQTEKNLKDSGGYIDISGMWMELGRWREDFFDRLGPEPDVRILAPILAQLLMSELEGKIPPGRYSLTMSERIEMLDIEVAVTYVFRMYRPRQRLSLVASPQSAEKASLQMVA